MDSMTMERISPPLPAEAKLFNEKLSKGKILRYNVDAFSIIAVFAAVSIQFIAYSLLPAPCSLLPAPCSLLPAPCSLWVIFIFLPLVIILMRVSHLAEHNHAHLPFFKNNALNEIIGWFMFLNCGIPLQSYREQHVNVHHRFLATPKDWTSPWSYQGTTFPAKPINKAYYFFSFMILSMLECGIIYARKPLSKSTFRFIVSMIIVGIVMTALALHNFLSFVIFYVVPWLVTYIYLAVASWKQHVNCDYTSVYTTAVNDLNIDSRKLGFNIGYHTAHHWYPTLHWSLLEKFHTIYLAPHLSPEYYTPMWFSSWRKKLQRLFRHYAAFFYRKRRLGKPDNKY